MNYYEFIKLIVRYSNMKSYLNSLRDNGKYELKKERRVSREVDAMFDNICKTASELFSNGTVEAGK